MTSTSTKTERRCTDCGAAHVAGPAARYCPACRPLHRRAKAVKYRLDGHAIELIRDRYDSRVPNRAAEIGRELGWPAYQVKKAACRLGLTRPWPQDRRGWTAEEIELLQQWEGLRSAKWIGKKLGRGETSVILKMRRLGLNRRVREGYTIRDVAQCFGVDHHTVDRWLRQGKLAARIQHTARPLPIHRISDAEILRFVRENRQEFRLDKVDQTWFLGLVFGVELASDLKEA